MKCHKSRQGHTGFCAFEIHKEQLVVLQKFLNAFWLIYGLYRIIIKIYILKGLLMLNSTSYQCTDRLLCWNYDFMLQNVKVKECWQTCIDFINASKITPWHYRIHEKQDVVPCFQIILINYLSCWFWKRFNAPFQ